jgi:receptor-type tyrosine-protein phosphatase Q
MNFTCSPLGANGIVVSWIPPPANSLNGVLRYFRVDITEEETSRSYFEILLGHHGSLDSLHPFYSYTVSVAAVTIGPGPSSNNVTITTDQDGELLTT